MLLIGDKPQVSDRVILLVSVDVVDAMAFRDGAIDFFPKSVMFEDEPSLDISSEVSLARDVASVFSCWFRPSFTHAESLTVSQLHVKRERRSALLAFAQ